MVSSERSDADQSELIILKKKIVYINTFLSENLKKCRFFYRYIFKVLQKFSDFVNSDDCIEKLTSKYVRLYPVFIKRICEMNKK